MIDTLYNLDALGAPHAFLLALLIGTGFGFALERAGFSSSRRLAGVFYFTDMAVVKVMFTALLTALLGLSYLSAAGWISFDRIFLMPTVYGAQIIGGLIFGVGFVMGGWCPGTAASGAASGKIDAVVFLVGAAGGSILFNEIFPVIKPLVDLGDRGVRFIYEDLGIARATFVLGFTLVGVAAFWLCEWAEKLRNGRSPYLGTPFLKAFSVALVAAAAGLLIVGPGSGADESAAGAQPTESDLLAAVDMAADHVEPEELADWLMAGEPELMVVDVRPAEEFAAFHIRGAVNIPLAELAQTLENQRNAGRIVLYSNGMTHPAQARDSLQRQGFQNVFILTDGLVGFRERCLMPVSLRAEPLDDAAAVRVNAWRAYFSGGGAAPAAASTALPAEAAVPRLVDTAWLVDRLGASDLRLIDLRPQPEYNTAHIPGSLSLNVESLRGNIGGVPSLLLPAPMLAAQFSLLGLEPTDMAVLVVGDKAHDATLAAMAFERLGHRRYAVLAGGFGKWLAENRPVDAALPPARASSYPSPEPPDDFTADFREVAAAIGKPGIVILDVRPAAYYTGDKSDEARAGHIPGAINRSYTEDVVEGADKSVSFKPIEDLAAAYNALIPDKQTRVVVHCRTGHQASQTFFVLKHLLKYADVRWYDAGWTEWATKPELPVER